jgi:hypothetical protein
VNFSTGQLEGFFGMFFRMFLFWDLLGIPEDLHGIKPAYLELFGLRIGRWGWGNLVMRGFWRIGKTGFFKS